MSGYRLAGESRDLTLHEKPLQLTDLVAGTVRRHLQGNPNEGRFKELERILQICVPLEGIENG